MRAPSFWSNPPAAPGIAARLLWPASLLFSLGGRMRRGLARPARAPIPVICVGNLIAGGAGKTPTVLALAERLEALGLEAHILSRGYGGRVRGPHRVDPRNDSFKDVGDEPLLMAQTRPVWVGADRAASARAAAEAGASVALLDDGFQNPRLAKDLSILVIDAAYGHGNGFVIPAGPLREGLRAGFARADAVIMLGDPPDAWPWTPPGLPVLHAQLTPRTTGLPLNGRRVVAFAGIGRPEKFFGTLRDAGAKLMEAIPFPDHHVYSPAILTRLEGRAASHDALLITTEKDAARMPRWFRGRYAVLPVTVGFDEPEAVDALLSRVLPEETRRRLRTADAEPVPATTRTGSAGGAAPSGAQDREPSDDDPDANATRPALWSELYGRGPRAR